MNKNFLNLNFPDDSNLKYSIENIALTAASLPPAANLDKIYLPALVVQSPVAEAQSERVRSNIFINGNPIPLQATEFSKQHILDFIAKTEAISTIPVECLHYINAVKIHYAINNGQFCLYFSPVMFCRDSENYGQGMHHFGTYQLWEDENDFYEYDSVNGFGAITAANKPTVITYIEAYQKPSTGVQIMEYRTSTNPTDFIVSNTIRGSAKSVIFTLQELIAVIEALPSSTKVKLWNWIEEVPYGSLHLIKHGILLSTENVSYNGGDLEIPYTLCAFLDLSHMCPPSCSGQFTFRLNA